MTEHDQELEDLIREENDKWYAEVVAEQKAAIARLKGGQMSSLVPDADDRSVDQMSLSVFEMSLLRECVRKEIEHLRGCIKTYEEMLEVENSAAPAVDREVIRLFSELCKKDVEKLTDLFDLLG